MLDQSPTPLSDSPGGAANERRELRRQWWMVWRRPVLSVAGGVVMLVGIVMLVAPGPGLVVMALALAIWAREYHWARRLLERLRKRIERARRHLDR